MKQLIYISLFSMLCVPSMAQTFNDCALSYHEKYNKMNYEQGRYLITRKTADSLRVVFDEELQRCIMGKEMPAYSLVGRSGKTYTNEDLKGKVVVLNFWSVNCGPCVMEIPVLNKLYLSYKDNKDVVFISILLDKEDALEKFLEKGLTKRRIVYEVVPDSKALMKDTFKLIKGYPTNLFIDREGKIFMRTYGGIIDPKDEDNLEAKLRSIIDNEL
jgi:thiol-disulfide isomerase/thioredoxin